LNEKLYTCSGEEAFAMMQEDSQMFTNYHTGFQTQTAGWPVKPVHVAIRFVESLRKKKGGGGGVTVADFGCGDAELAAHFAEARATTRKAGEGGAAGSKKKRRKSGGPGDNGGRVTCHSFDLVSENPLVHACNMAAVPLEAQTCDVAVFCLALMGNDYPLFLREASRVLKPGGTCWIAEVRSRFSQVKGGDGAGSDFVKCMARHLGCELRSHDNANKMFVTYVFEMPLEKTPEPASDEAFVAKWPKLSSCMYKKR